MPKKYSVTVDDGVELADAGDGSGGKRGFVCQDGKIVEHVVLHEENETDVSIIEGENNKIQEHSESLSGKIDLAITALGLFASKQQAKREKERLNNQIEYQKGLLEIETERQKRELQYREQQIEVVEKAHEEARRMRFENLFDDMEEAYYNSEPEYVVEMVETKGEPQGFMQAVDSVLADCAHGITSTDAQLKLLEIIETCRGLSRQIQEYAQICVNQGSEIPDNYYQWQKAIEKMVTDRVIMGLNMMIEKSPELSTSNQTLHNLLSTGETSATDLDVLRISRERLGEYLHVDVDKKFAKQATEYCPKCGAQVSSGDAFCISCGTPLKGYTR